MLKLFDGSDKFVNVNPKWEKELNTKFYCLYLKLLLLVIRQDSVVPALNNGCCTYGPQPNALTT